MRYIIYLLFIATLFLLSCTISTEEKEDVLVSYNQQTLLWSDIEYLYPNSLSKEDSLDWIETVKREWLNNQIIIVKAEKELPNQEKDIKLELLQYQADLLKFKFENYYIKNKINTHISNSEIEDYYNKYKPTLIVLEPLVKAVYIEIPNTVKKRYKVKQWLLSKREKDEEKLKVFCFQNAKVFDDFEGNWVKLKQLRLITQSDKLQINRIVENIVVEQKDDETTHYIFINKIIKKGAIMPFAYAKKEIMKIIRNKRKSRLLEVFNGKIEEQVNQQLKKK